MTAPVLDHRVCVVCGHADRILIPIGSGWVCLNVDRCTPAAGGRP